MLLVSRANSRQMEFVSNSGKMLTRKLFFFLIACLADSDAQLSFRLLEQCQDGQHSLELSDSSVNSAVELTLSRHPPYPGNSRCSLTVSAPWADGLLFVVRMLNMRWDVTRCLDYMKLVDNERVLLAPLCTSRAIGSRFVAMRENRITLVVVTTKSTPSGNYTGLNILFTGYVSKNRCSPNDMFLCMESKICISKALFCDGIDHCGDGTDEPEDCESRNRRTWIEWAPLLSWLSVYGLFSAVLFKVYSKKKRSILVLRNL
ncbi:uncharacterized protein LOC119166800 isoform X1 [Rhipicephalus microplus]|uniref:uncharacterized protein LOC119166800 isoform X1 n=1 Tax=Rhipicephalus microplus TaxID=6941 RepID=UPI003F6BE911